MKKSILYTIIELEQALFCLSAMNKKSAYYFVNIKQCIGLPHGS